MIKRKNRYRYPGSRREISAHKHWLLTFPPVFLEHLLGSGSRRTHSGPTANPSCVVCPVCPPPSSMSQEIKIARRPRVVESRSRQSVRTSLHPRRGCEVLLGCDGNQASGSHTRPQKGSQGWQEQSKSRVWGMVGWARALLLGTTRLCNSPIVSQSC